VGRDFWRIEKENERTSGFGKTLESILTLKLGKIPRKGERMRALGT